MTSIVIWVGLLLYGGLILLGFIIGYVVGYKKGTERDTTAFKREGRSRIK